MADNGGDRVGLGSTGHFDKDIYGGSDSTAYVTSIGPGDEEEADAMEIDSVEVGGKRAQYTAPAALMKEMAQGDAVRHLRGYGARGVRCAASSRGFFSARLTHVCPPVCPCSRTLLLTRGRPASLTERTSIMPGVATASSLPNVPIRLPVGGGRLPPLLKVSGPPREGESLTQGTPLPPPSFLSPLLTEGQASADARTYSDVMLDKELEDEHAAVRKKVAEKAKEGSLPSQTGVAPGEGSSASGPRKSRWDSAPTESEATTGAADPAATPQGTGSRWDQPTPQRKRNRWDETPTAPVVGGTEKKRSRWDETPVSAPMMAAAATPVGNVAMGLATPTPGHMAGLMTPEQVQTARWEREIDERNRPMSDEELDAIFPKEG